MESPNTQEPTSEKIKKHHEIWKDLLSQKTGNLKRRTDREISGVELDRLDAEIDEKIGQVRQEINALVDQTKVEETPETGNGESTEVTDSESSGETLDETAIASQQEQLDILRKRLDSYNTQNVRASENPDKEAFMNTEGLEQEIAELTDKISKIKDKTQQSPDQKTEDRGSHLEKLGEEELYMDRIKNAPDLRNLVNYIAELGDITAPDGYVYKKEDMLRTIGNLKDSSDPELQKITRTYGLRDKVKLLLVKRELGIS